MLSMCESGFPTVKTEHLVGCTNTHAQTHTHNINSVSRQYGDNNHIEYKKSESTLQERIIQFQFQLVRTKNNDGFKNIATETREILSIIMSGINNPSNSAEHKKYIDMGVIMFKLLAHTRDIVAGKGECMLFYVMLMEWADINFMLFDFVINSLVYDTSNYIETDIPNTIHPHPHHPLGSWKDMKYFLTFMKQHVLEQVLENASYNTDMYSQAVNRIIYIINNQLHIDSDTMNIITANTNSSKLSLVAKWIPREKSKKFGWLYYYLVMNYSHHQIPSDTMHPSYERAVNRAFMIYRKLISAINKHLDTTQIKQCGRTWSEINFDNVTSITLNKQTNSFLNLKRNGKMARHECNEDRNECKKNYEQYLQEVVKGDKKIKGKRVSMIDFVKRAVDNKGLPDDSPIITAINEQWKNNAHQNGNLAEIIAMCDTSDSMTSDNSDSLYSAIGLSIRVAEKSALGARVLSFAERPSWIQLGTSDSDTFVKQVNKVREASWGMTSNFYSALDLIRQGIEDNKLPREVAEKLVLVVFSDMQMNVDASSSSSSSRATLFENCKQMFAKMGERLYGEPVKTPHIILWNLRKTCGYPALSGDENVSMISGFSPSLLNTFCQKGVAGLDQYINTTKTATVTATVTPWLSFTETLNNKRYSVFETAFKNIVVVSPQSKSKSK